MSYMMVSQSHHLILSTHPFAQMLLMAGRLLPLPILSEFGELGEAAKPRQPARGTRGKSSDKLLQYLEVVLTGSQF